MPTIEKTQTWVQHGDDLSRDISNAVLEWQRRNPGKVVREIYFHFEHDALTPHAMIKVTVESEDDAADLHHHD